MQMPLRAHLEVMRLNGKTPKQNDEFTKEVSAMLKNYRERSGLSVQQMADKTGLSVAGVQKIEKGRTSPTLRSIKIYVEACGRNLAEAFEEWLPSCATRADKVIHRDLDEVIKDPEQKEVIVGMLKQLLKKPRILTK